MGTTLRVVVQVVTRWSAAPAAIESLAERTVTFFAAGAPAIGSTVGRRPTRSSAERAEMYCGVVPAAIVSKGTPATTG